MEESIDIETHITNTKNEFEKTIGHLKEELSKIRAGKASPAMLDAVRVDYYGTLTPISQVANLGTPDGRTISIQPWEKKLLGPIERAIFEANLGMTPQNDGEFIRIIIPPLTAERRQVLVKQCKALSEDSKVAIRNGRHKIMEFIKKEVKNGYPEDAGKKRESEVEAMVKDYYKKVEALMDAKEQDILTV